MNLQKKLTLLDHQTLVVSPSQLDEIKTCARRWLYKYIYRRAPATGHPATIGGKAVDAALNYRYTTLGGGKVTPEVEARMLAIVDEGYKGVTLDFDEYRTPARYKEVVQAYNQWWPEERFKVLGVQVPFAVELGEVPIIGYRFWDKVGWDTHNPPAFVKILLQGIMDMVVELPDGSISIVDTKTNKEALKGAYLNSAQMKAYGWAMQELARVNPDCGLPPKVNSTFINQLIIRPPYKNPAYVGKSNAKPRNEFHRTFPEMLKPELLEEWRADTLLHVEQALGWVARDHFPANERMCNMLYGKPCCYRDEVCLVTPEQRIFGLGCDKFTDYERGPMAEIAKGEEAENP